MTSPGDAHIHSLGQGIRKRKREHQAEICQLFWRRVAVVTAYQLTMASYSIWLGGGGNIMNKMFLDICILILGFWSLNISAPPIAYIAADNFSDEAVFVAAEGAHVPIKGLKDMRMCFSNSSYASICIFYTMFFGQKAAQCLLPSRGSRQYYDHLHNLKWGEHQTLINGMCIQLIRKKREYQNAKSFKGQNKLWFFNVQEEKKSYAIHLNEV